MGRLLLPRWIYDSLMEAARSALPNECCGLLGGHGEEVTRIYGATNHLASPVAFEIPPAELFEIFRDLRTHRLQLVGIYHSHPHGDNTPSERDLEQAYYPDAAMVIVVPRLDTPAPVRAFGVAGQQVRELEVEVTG